MKVERIFSEGTALLNSTTAEKIVKEEKHVLDTDAVTFDSERKKDQQQSANQQASEEEKSKEEAINYAPKQKPPAEIHVGKALDILV